MEVKKNLSSIKYYKDADELITECDYKYALKQMDNGKLMEAYDLFSELGDYSNSKSKLSETEQLIYHKGIELYQDESYSETETYFKESQNCGRESDYLKLIEAHTTTISDISTLYPLIGFEDTADLLLSADYIDEFMLGRWSDHMGNYVEYYKKNPGDSETQCTYNVPYTEGEHYKLEDGVHLHGSDESGWTKQWSYTVLTADAVNAYCFKDGRTYTLYRINEE